MEFGPARWAEPLHYNGKVVTRPQARNLLRVDKHKQDLRVYMTRIIQKRRSHVKLLEKTLKRLILQMLEQEKLLEGRTPRSRFHLLAATG